MLAEQAAKNPAKRWATIAPNYAYGKDAVSAFKKILKSLRPDVEFVAEQWPALFKIDAGAEIQALAAANPEAVYNVTFGGDLAKFAREGKLRQFFDGKLILGLLTGEPEYLDPLKGEAPEGWLVTGYPWYAINTAAHNAFRKAYEGKYNDYPRIGSIVGYNTMLGIAAAIKKSRINRHRSHGGCDGRFNLRFSYWIHHLQENRPSIHHGSLSRLDGIERWQRYNGQMDLPERSRLSAL